MDLERENQFTYRHIGPGEAEQAEMLAYLGYASLDELVEAAIPESIRTPGSTAIDQAASEEEVQGTLLEIAGRNRTMRQMIGLGYYDSIMPAVIRRNLLENPAWYTAYTPYQAEISQGRLEALLVFQTVVCELSGLAFANASLLDEASAAAEAMTLCVRSAPGDRRPAFVVDADCLPQTVAVLRTRAEPLGIDLVVAEVARGEPVPGHPAGILIQYPGASGAIRDLAPPIAAAHDRGALVVMAADPLALCLLRSPGELGADIAIGSTQRFGLPLSFGGPHAAYIAVRPGLERSLPGRVVGVSRDVQGNPAFRLAVQTREQHIRRDRATSNICTAQVLPAVLAAMYAVYHGPEGLRSIAERVHRHAGVLASRLGGMGVEVLHQAFFDTVLARVPDAAAQVVALAAAAGINLRLLDADHVGISCDERTERDCVEACLGAFAAALGAPAPAAPAGAAPVPPGPAPAAPASPLADAGIDDRIPAGWLRTTGFLSHPVFHRHRSETSMLRYLRSLADRDYALDRGMIPLGSCTMKLNATFEMEPLTWPAIAGIHPFAPTEQTQGYARLIAQLEEWLAAITGYDAVFLAPNAGSQGELAGLLAIRAYQRASGQDRRSVCLIPTSAHGTNAASAVLAGLRVVAVACDQAGNVDHVDLKAKVAEHHDRLCALMVTYPSTHGVYEEGIVEACRQVHDAGGQVYLDGANLNALVGMASLAEIGGDVSHLNLHKTFCIPHGGGGPGVGPVAVRAHLAPFVPSVTAAPFGSAGVLPITWAYIAMMGSAGLALASKVAVLSANYLARRLSAHFPVLYSGRDGLVAHECILDLRALTRASGVSVTDVAKRLIDHGFHAPTVSFPVAGTLMIEPTESEDLAELDRFCEAMAAIRAEIDQVVAGHWPRDDNPLKGAPHTAASLADEWTHPYSRAEAAFPREALRKAKYWAPVARIDEAWGDRHLLSRLPEE